MKVLIVAYYFPPDNNGGVQRPLAFYNIMKEEGVHVEVVTHGIKTEQKSDIHRVYDLNKSTIPDKLLFYAGRSLSKALSLVGIYTSYYFLWERNVSRYLKKNISKISPDVIIFTYPPVECLKVAESLVKWSNCKVVIDYRDPLIFESAEQQVFNRYRYMETKYRRLEAFLARSSDLSLHVSPAMKEYFDQQYQHTENILLPNGFHKRDLDELNLENTSQLDSMFSPTKLSLLYTGTLSFYDKDRNLDVLFDAIRLLEDTSKIEVILVGDFKKTDFTQNQDLLDSGIIKVYPKILRKESLYIQSKADVLLLVTGNKRKSIATGKLFEYLFSGKPILAFAKDNFAYEIVTRSATGNCFSNDEADNLCLYLKEKIKEHFVNGISYQPDKQYINLFERKSQVRGLVNKLKEITRK